MARIARVVVPELPHQVTQRGNRQMRVFESPEDCRRYLELLARYCEREGVRIWAYCLMPNHIHLIAVPSTSEGLGLMLRDVHQNYAAGFNVRSQTSGHLWQGRFYSCVLDDSHLWTAVRYVELNPVRAGLVARAEEYLWSSAANHAAGRAGSVLDGQLPLLQDVDVWSEWLAEGAEEQATVDALRRNTTTGRPCGDGAFVARIGEQTGRDLRKRPPGPQRA